ncbi:hypothetical protein SISNIDRAFT_513005, partial [Sistotremastrum niveocremeum HHB9708]
MPPLDVSALKDTLSTFYPSDVSSLVSSSLSDGGKAIKDSLAPAVLAWTSSELSEEKGPVGSAMHTTQNSFEPPGSHEVVFFVAAEASDATTHEQSTQSTQNLNLGSVVNEDLLNRTRDATSDLAERLKQYFDSTKDWVSKNHKAVIAVTVASIIIISAILFPALIVGLLRLLGIGLLGITKGKGVEHMSQYERSRSYGVNGDTASLRRSVR